MLKTGNFTPPAARSTLKVASPGATELRWLRVKAAVQLQVHVVPISGGAKSVSSTGGAKEEDTGEGEGEGGVESSPNGTESWRHQVQAVPSPGGANLSNSNNVKLPTLRSEVYLE